MPWQIVLASMDTAFCVPYQSRRLLDGMRITEIKSQCISVATIVFKLDLMTTLFQEAQLVSQRRQLKSCSCKITLRWTNFWAMAALLQTTW